MPRRFQFSLRALLVVGSATFGCVRSEKPLVSEEESVIDGDLLGVWQTDFGDVGGEMCSISIHPKLGSETVLEAVADTEGPVVEVRTTKVGQERYLCLRHADEPHVSYILRYEFRGNEVRFYELDENVMHNAIRNGELRGKAWYFLWQRADLSGDAVEIQAYLERHRKDRFCFHPWDAIPSMERREPR